MKDLHGGDIYGAAKRLGIRPGEVLDFSASLNPLGPPPAAALAARKALATSVSPYPALDAAPLTAAIAERFGVGEECLLAANGSTETIYLAAQVYRPRRALVVGPAFSEYARSLEAVRTVVEYFMASEEDFFVPDISRLLEKIGASKVGASKAGSGPYDIVYLANPSNPAGAVVDREDVLRLARQCREAGAVLVVDEAFADFAPESSVLKDAAFTEGLLVLRSLTKYYALAGLRLGFMAATEETIERFRAMKPPWSVNTVAIAAGVAALGDRAFDGETESWLREERRRLAEGFEATGSFRVFPSAANYLLVKAESPQAAGEIKEMLFRKGILIRDLSTMVGLDCGTFFRVAVLARADNELLLGEVAGISGTKKTLERCII